MHECPGCGTVCDCDGEDIWWEFDSEAVEECMHNCDEEDYEDDDLDYYEAD